LGAPNAAGIAAGGTVLALATIASGPSTAAPASPLDASEATPDISTSFSNTARLFSEIWAFRFWRGSPPKKSVVTSKSGRPFSKNSDCGHD
jgi:hypothetical protein